MVPLLVAAHRYNFFLIIIACLVAGIWGLILFFRKSGMNKPWRSSLIVVTALGLLQGLLGLTMLLLGLKAGSGTGLYYLHYVYGAIVALGVPIILSFTTGGKDERRDILYFSIGVLIVAAAAIRAFMTGPA